MRQQDFVPAMQPTALDTEAIRHRGSDPGGYLITRMLRVIAGVWQRRLWRNRHPAMLQDHCDVPSILCGTYTEPAWVGDKTQERTL